MKMRCWDEIWSKKEIWNYERWISKHVIIVNDSDYSNPYNESNDNKAVIKEWIAEVVKVLLTCVVIKAITTEAINNNHNDNNSNNNN